MTIYAIGPVLGDYQTLMELLQEIAFDSENDRLWFVGNLVNGGLDSLSVLRFVKSLGKNAVTVLGNQELHLLSVAAGSTSQSANDTLDNILNAPDKDELLKWVRQRGLIHHDAKLNFTMVHAGIPGEWTFSQALTFAYEVESVLSGGRYPAFLENRRQDQSRWHAKLTGWKRLNFIANAYTLMAYSTEQGKLDFNARGAVSEQIEGMLPWYRWSGHITASQNVVFADDTGFGDDTCHGIYPLASRKVLSALTLSATPETVSVFRRKII